MEQEINTGSRIIVREIGKTVGGTPLLSGISLEVAPGECFGILGENGSGKTTLLRIITGLIAPSVGDVLVAGNSPHSHPALALGKMGVLIGIPAFYPNIGAFANLRLFWDGPSGAGEAHIMNALSAVGLADEREKKVGAFSRGMLQRLGVAHACMHQRPYIILDEPTQGVDDYWIARLISLFQDMVRAGKSFIITSHDYDFVTKLCSRVLILSEGRTAYLGELKMIAEYPYYYHLRCAPVEKTAAVLARLDYIHKCIRNIDSFYLTLPSERAPELVNELVSEGCHVHECARKHYSVADLIRQREG